ncbi:MAG: hypothetical protein QXX35_04510 [Desulfurococcaceae archaeon]|uniref:Uncharacterized protein n=1 Tax=Staphylothermus marinus TaxID=2280 RepID=A0A7C4D965_STAMA
MPKTPSVILRIELSKKGFELLDVYFTKEGDIIRYKDTSSGRVYLYFSKKHVRDFIQRDEIVNLVNELVNNARSEKS